jgi:autotransporter strand-loop-strand O-heptosyltransferase
VVCSTFHNDLFENVYPEIEFVNPGSSVDGVLGLYRIGLFYNNEQVDYEWHPYNPLKEPLQKIASDILGLDYKEILPEVPSLGGHKKKRVCIAIHSTSQCKYWNNPDGWQKVVDYVKSKGYEVRLLSREEDGYMGNKHPKGIKVQPPSSTKDVLKVLQESHLFIGISSGLSWLAWSSGIPVVLISGFTDIYLEPFKNIERIINKDVCHGCWHNHKFDPGNWNWCPIHEKTDKQFECSKEITSEQVISKIEKFF